MNRSTVLGRYDAQNSEKGGSCFSWGSWAFRPTWAALMEGVAQWEGFPYVDLELVHFAEFILASSV